MAGTGWGITAGRKLHSRAVSLELLSRFTEQLAERIRYTTAPLAVLLRELAASAELERLPLLRCIPTAEDPRGALCEAAEACAGEMALNTEDTRLLTEFIRGWGNADVTGEVQRCRQYAARFRERCEAARADARCKEKLYVTLGICGGSMAALLLGG